MDYAPPFDRFSTLARDVDYVPIYRRLLSDVLTPVQAFKKLDVSPAACLFERVIGGEKVGRYSFLASDPYLQIEAHGTQVTLSRARTFQRRAREPVWSTESLEADNPVEILRGKCKR